MRKNQITINAKMLFIILSMFLLIIVGMNALYNSPVSPIIILSGMRGVESIYPFDGFVGTFFTYDNLFVILGAVTIFALFLRIHIQSQMINKIAGLTYGAYIIHVFWIHVLSECARISPFIRFESGAYFLYTLSFIFLVGVLSLITEFVRKKIMNSLVGAYKMLHN